MKLSKIMIVFLMIIFSLMQPCQVKAQVEFDFTNQEILASISSDGSVKFVDYQTYEVDYFNGAYFNLDRTNFDVTDYRVGVIDPFSNQIEYFEENATGSPRTFQLTQSNDLYTFKVFYPAENERVTFVFEYTLAELITNFSDTAEFNRKIVGTGTDDYFDVEATIVLPGTVKNPEDFRAWAHGAPQGNIELTEYEGKSAVRLEVKDNPPRQFVEANIIFPTALTPNNKNRRQVDKKAEIIAREEGQVQKDREAYESRLGWISFFAMLASTVMPLLPIGLLLYYRTKRREYNPHPEKLPRHIYYLPEDISPAIMATTFFRKKPTTEDLTATIVDLARKGFITLTPVKKEKRGLFSRGEEETIFIEPIDNPENQIQLQKHEQFALNYITPFAEGITLQDLEDLLSKDKALQKKQSKYWTKFADFAEVKGMQLRKTPRAQSVATAFTVMGLGVVPVLLALCLLLTRFTPYQRYWQYMVIIAVVSWVALFVLLIVIITHPIATAEHDRRKKEWIGFKNMLNDIGNFDMREIGSLDLWEEFLVYAVSLGVAEKVVEAMKMQFRPMEMESMHIGGGFYANPYLMTRALNQSVSNSVQLSQPTVTSQYKGSNIGGFGGGFSGGSSGGSGGGSGSGGF